MIVLEANYAKKLGLPGFSSHQYSVSIRTELNDLSQVEQESSRLYELLQHSVDQQIQSTGFVPDAAYGVANGHDQRGQRPHTNGNGHQQSRKNTLDPWNCTEGQRGFILRILNENNISKQDAEDLANQLFGVGVKQMNKMQASQLIEDLLVKAGKPPRQNRWRPSQPQQPQTASAS